MVGGGEGTVGRQGPQTTADGPDMRSRAQDSGEDGESRGGGRTKASFMPCLNVRK